MRKVRPWLIAAAALILTAAIGVRAIEAYLWCTGRDFAKHSPEQNFSYIFNREAPQGLTTLRFAGRTYFIKQWFWMTGKVNDAALKDLLQNTNLQSTTKISVSELPFTNPSPKSDYDVIDKASVDWQEMDRVEQPEYFRWSTYNPNMSHYGYFVIDRKRRLFFAAGLTE